MKIYLAITALSLAAVSTAKEHGSLRSRDLIRVGANKCPPSLPDCDPRGQWIEPCDQTNKLTKACPGADYCTNFPGYTEYECGCERDNKVCATENAVCLTGYKLMRLDKGNQNGSTGGNGLFYACDCVDDKYCDVVQTP
jgi:hypothetical protein